MEYKLHVNYRDTEWLREAFFEFTQTIFSLSFREWYDQGFWGEQYRCYSLLDGEKMISNVSLSHLRVLVDGSVKRAIQIATVGTLDAYRGKGLSRRLMEMILSEYKDKVDLIFLSANNSVLDFYPRFGFKRVLENDFTAKVPEIETKSGARKMHLGCPEDMDIIARLLKERKPISNSFCVLDSSNIFMWYLVNFYGKCVWHIEDLDTMVVCEVEEQTLQIYDIVQKGSFEFLDVLPYLPHTDYDTIRFDFTPDLMNIEVDSQPILHEDPFFIQGSFGLEGTAFRVQGLART